MTGSKTTDNMPNALKNNNNSYQDQVVVKAGAITVSADGTKHLDIVKFLETPAGRTRLSKIMSHTKVTRDE